MHTPPRNFATASILLGTSMVGLITGALGGLAVNRLVPGIPRWHWLVFLIVENAALIGYMIWLGRPWRATLSQPAARTLCATLMRNGYVEIASGENSRFFVANQPESVLGRWLRPLTRIFVIEAAENAELIAPTLFRVLVWKKLGFTAGS